MANGYERGDYLGQFLTQLPQIYQAQENMKLQRERFEHGKEQDYKDDIYRSQVVQTNEERNRLAREQFTQKKLENTQDEAYRTQYLENAKATQEYNEFNQNFTTLAGNKEAQTYLLKQKYKDNPAMLDMIDEHRDVTESMAFQVRELEGMSPLDAIRSGRPLYASEYLDDKLKGQLDTTLQGKEEDLKFTLKDLEGTPLGPEYAMYYERFINKDKYLPAGTSATQRMQYDELHLKKMDEIYEQAKEEQIIGGPWNEPFFENMDVEGADDNEIEEILVDWDKDTIANYVDISPYGEVTKPVSTQRAGVGGEQPSQPTDVTRDATDMTQGVSQPIGATAVLDAMKSADGDAVFMLDLGDGSQKRIRGKEWQYLTQLPVSQRDNIKITSRRESSHSDSKMSKEALREFAIGGAPVYIKGSNKPLQVERPPKGKYGVVVDGVFYTNKAFGEKFTNVPTTNY
tara:strand:+ start:306 stop:1676 length:1371 start_codon:yes stop_codon:yes gene_type:complete